MTERTMRNRVKGWIFVGIFTVLFWASAAYFIIWCSTVSTR